jgi:hypothetical protein
MARNRVGGKEKPSISDVSPEIPVLGAGDPPRSRPGRTPSDDDIRARAYERYLSRGRSDGQALEDWLAAERELRSQRPSTRAEA